MGREAVIVEGETIEIPYRIHYPELAVDALEATSRRQQLIAGYWVSTSSRSVRWCARERR
jgi:hypothetical protein